MTAKDTKSHNTDERALFNPFGKSRWKHEASFHQFYAALSIHRISANVKEFCIAFIIWTIVQFIEESVTHGEVATGQVLTSITMIFVGIAAYFYSVANSKSPPYNALHLQLYGAAIFSLYSIANFIWAHSVHETALSSMNVIYLIVLLSSISPVFRCLFGTHLIVSFLIATAYFVALVIAYSHLHIKNALIEVALCFTLACIVLNVQSYYQELHIRTTYALIVKKKQEEAQLQIILQRMLPENIISKLLAQETCIYQKHDRVSILFSNVNEFDELSGSLYPIQLVQYLNHLFSQFDTLTDLHGVYKVETVGSVYLVASGCPEHFRTQYHAHALASLALDMQLIIHGCQLVDVQPIEIRVGIHTGPVIAGVVGNKYPRYRLMGDTVNIASRMSTTCEAGDIQLSSATIHELEQSLGSFVIAPRGETFVKGIGMMNTSLLIFGPCCLSIAGRKLMSKDPMFAAQYQQINSIMHFDDEEVSNKRSSLVLGDIDETSLNIVNEVLHQSMASELSINTEEPSKHVTPPISPKSRSCSKTREDSDSLSSISIVLPVVEEDKSEERPPPFVKARSMFLNTDELTSYDIPVSPRGNFDPNLTINVDSSPHPRRMLRRGSVSEGPLRIQKSPASPRKRTGTFDGSFAPSLLHSPAFNRFTRTDELSSSPPSFILDASPPIDNMPIEMQSLTVEIPSASSPSLSKHQRILLASPTEEAKAKAKSAQNQQLRAQISKRTRRYSVRMDPSDFNPSMFLTKKKVNDVDNSQLPKHSTDKRGSEAVRKTSNDKTDIKEDKSQKKGGKLSPTEKKTSFSKPKPNSRRNSAEKPKSRSRRNSVSSSDLHNKETEALAQLAAQGKSLSHRKDLSHNQSSSSLYSLNHADARDTQKLQTLSERGKNHIQNIFESFNTEQSNDDEITFSDDVLSLASLDKVDQLSIHFPTQKTKANHHHDSRSIFPSPVVSLGTTPARTAYATPRSVSPIPPQFHGEMEIVENDISIEKKETVQNQSHSYMKDFFNKFKLSFQQSDDLELAYQNNHIERHADAALKTMMITSIVFLFLLFYDVFAPAVIHVDHPVHAVSHQPELLVGVISIKLVTFLCSCVGYGIAKYWNIRWTMIIVAINLTFIGFAIILISLITNTYQTTYTVTLIVLVQSMLASRSFVPYSYAQICIILIQGVYMCMFMVAKIDRTIQRNRVYHHDDDIFANLVLLVLFSVMYSRVAYYFEKDLRADFTTTLATQKRHNELSSLLDNMLPTVIMREIQANPLSSNFIVHERDHASIMFTDIVGFTSLCARIPAEDVVAILNVVFAKFDEITSYFRVFKVETIGDAYLCCTGVVFEDENEASEDVKKESLGYEAALDLVNCALAFKQALSSFVTDDDMRIRIRSGIHTGYVIAGVVGIKMPRYHLFGDSITIAEEVEHTGIADQVIITESTYNCLKALGTLDDKYLFTLRSKKIFDIYNTYVVRRNLIFDEISDGKRGHKRRNSSMESVKDIVLTRIASMDKTTSSPGSGKRYSAIPSRLTSKSTGKRNSPVEPARTLQNSARISSHHLTVRANDVVKSSSWNEIHLIHRSINASPESQHAQRKDLEHAVNQEDEEPDLIVDCDVDNDEIVFSFPSTSTPVR